MSAGKNLARAIKRIQMERGKSLIELSEELDIPLTTLKKYASGNANPTMDSMERLSKSLNVPIMELISGPSRKWEQTEILLRAAEVLSKLSPERQKDALELLPLLVELFSD